MVVCEKCGNSAPEGSRFCNHCGSSVPAPRETPQPEMKHDETPCPKCGKAVPLYRGICPNCGRSLSSPVEMRDSGSARTCARCGRPISAGHTICAICSSIDALRARAPRHESPRPVIVGILLIGAFVLSMMSFVGVMIMSEEVEGMYPVDVSGFIVCCGMVFLGASVSCIVGALLSFRRKKHILVVLAAAIGILGIGPFFLGSLMSLIAMILAAISGDEYGR